MLEGGLYGLNERAAAVEFDAGVERPDSLKLDERCKESHKYSTRHDTFLSGKKIGKSRRKYVHLAQHHINQQDEIRDLVCNNGITVEFVVGLMYNV